MSIENKIHSIIIRLSISLTVWCIINLYIFPITIYEYIGLEIIIGFSQLLTIFVKRSFGIFNPRISKYLEQDKKDYQDGL